MSGKHILWKGEKANTMGDHKLWSWMHQLLHRHRIPAAGALSEILRVTFQRAMATQIDSPFPTTIVEGRGCKETNHAKSRQNVEDVSSWKWHIQYAHMDFEEHSALL